MRIGLTIFFALAAAGTAYADDPLDQAAIAQAKAQDSTAAQVGNFYRGAGEKTDYQVLLEAGKCYWFSGSSEGLTKLYMYLWKPNSNMFTPRVADLRSPGQGTMAYCTQEAGMYKFQVKTEGKKGHFVVAVFAKEAPKQMAAPAAPVEEKHGPDLGPLCDKRAAAVAPGAHRVGEFFEGHGNSIGHDDRFDYPIQLDGGKCYWFIGCGEPDHIKQLTLFMWGPNNKRVTEDKGDSATPMVGTCAKETGMYKVQAKISGGSGYFKAALYTK